MVTETEKTLSAPDHRQVLTTLLDLGDVELASRSLRYFKTGPGDYGEEDVFLGIRMPVIRQQVKLFSALPYSQTVMLLHSKFHEARMTALLIWVNQFRRADAAGKKQIAEGYLANTKQINSWDLVDCSAHLVIGPWAEHSSVNLLRNLARSSSLWERRIAMMSTLHFIRQNEFAPTLELADMLLQDREDLIHKVVGWMLREVGNRDRAVEEQFLRSRYREMPRTMLRYAIEKFPESHRRAYLKGDV